MASFGIFIFEAKQELPISVRDSMWCEGQGLLKEKPFVEGACLVRNKQGQLGPEKICLSSDAFLGHPVIKLIILC
jgi:hypothetical protein